MMWLYPISLLLLVLYIAIIGYYHFLLRKAKPFAGINHKGNTYVTVIIPARNESNNIADCLNSMAAQSYSPQWWEIIVVDDYSTDNTIEIVNTFAAANKHLNITIISLKDVLGNRNINSYKKKGIETAVQQAKGELIVTTDADCTVKQHWLEIIVQYYETTNAQCIAAPVRLVNSHKDSNEKTNLVQAFQTLDFLTLQGITMGAVAAGKHILCNGANFAFTKAAFNAVKGYSKIDDIASGDDVLLMQKIKRAYPYQVHYLKSKNVIVNSLTEKTWSGFLNQRIRWASKAGYYDDKLMLFVMILVFMINLCTIGLIASLIINAKHWMWVLIFVILKFSIDYRFVAAAAKYFNQQKLLRWFPISFMLYPIYIIVAGIFGKIGRFTWKGRAVR